jgi:hypothetical protein
MQMLADATAQVTSTDLQFLGNTLWQWLTLLGVLLGSLVVGKIISFILQHQAKRLDEHGRLRIVLWPA